jgi:hypothetical protein
MLWRGRQRGWPRLGACEPVSEFDRRPFEHPLLSPSRAPSGCGRGAFLSTVDRVQQARASRWPRLEEGANEDIAQAVRGSLDESAGKRRSTRVRKGAPWLKPVLVQCAWAAARKKYSYFQAQFLRLKARCGPKKAVVAVAASLLATAYHMLADGTCCQDLGADHFARRDPARIVAKLANRIRSLGYAVDIRAAA